VRQLAAAIIVARRGESAVDAAAPDARRQVPQPQLARQKLLWRPSAQRCGRRAQQKRDAARF